MGTEGRTTGALAQASFSGLFWNYSGVIVRNALAFLVSIPLARLLGPEPFGQVALAWVIIGLGNLLADFGFSSALVQKDTIGTRDVRFVFTIQILLGLFWFGLVAGSAPLAARFFHDPGLVRVLRWLAGMFLLQSAGQVATGLLRRELAFKRIQVAQVGSYLVSYLLVGLPMAWLGKGVWAIVWAQLLQVGLYSLTVYAFTRHAVLPCMSAASGRSMGSFGLKVLATNLCNWTIGNVDNLIVGRWMGAVPLGFYSRAFSLITAPLNAFITTLQGVLFPLYSRIQDRRTDQGRLYLALFEGVALVTMPVFFSVAAVAPTVMVGLFGPRWAPAAPILMALAASMPFLALLGLAGPLLWGIGRVGLELRIQVIVAAFTLVILLGFARGSIEAFSWAVAGIYLVRFILMTVQVAVLLSLPARALLRSLGAGTILAFLVAASVRMMDGVLRAQHVPLMLTLALGALTFLVLAGGAVLAFRRWLFGSSLCWLAERLGTHLGGRWPARMEWLFVSKGTV